MEVSLLMAAAAFIGEAIAFGAIFRSRSEYSSRNARDESSTGLVSSSTRLAAECVFSVMNSSLLCTASSPMEMRALRVSNTSAIASLMPPVSKISSVVILDSVLSHIRVHEYSVGNKVGACVGDGVG